MTEEQYVTQLQFDKFKDDLMPRINDLEKDVLLIPKALEMLQFQIQVNTDETKLQRRTIDQAISKILKYLIGGVVTFVTAVLGMAISVIASGAFDLAAKAAN